MSVTFVTYLWHYLAARAIYDDLVRPLTHGDPTGLFLVGLLVTVGFLLGRQTTRTRRP